MNLTLPERLPPHDLAAERALLGAMLMAGSSDGLVDIDDVASIVASADAFYNHAHRDVYRIIVTAHQRGEPMDLIVLEERLSDSGALAQVGGHEYLIELAESFADIANAEHYARIVAECYVRRRLILIGSSLAAEAHQARETTPTAEITAHAMCQLDALDEEGIGDHGPVVADELMRQLVAPNDRDSRKVPIRPIQLADLFDGGLEAGSLTVIGARPSCGKTSLGLGMALTAVQCIDGCPAVFFSLEMLLNPSIAERLLTALTGIPMADIRSGVVSDERFATAQQNANQQLARAPHRLFLVDKLVDSRAIIAVIKRYARKHGVRLVVIDYLGLVRHAGRFERHDLCIGEITKSLKRVATETGVAVVLLAQLNREVARADREPRMYDLMDSSRIEQDADAVLLIHPDGKNSERMAETTLILDKNRQGQTGRVKVLYDRHTLTFHRSVLDDWHDAATYVTDSDGR